MPARRSAHIEPFSVRLDGRVVRADTSVAAADRKWTERHATTHQGGPLGYRHADRAV